MKSYKFCSYSRRIDRKDVILFAWCMFVDGTWAELSEIREIEYTLHPSFPDPVRVIREPMNCFALQSQGWGEFNIRARVMLADDSVVKKTFYLKLEDDAWPRGQRPVEFSSRAAENIYSSLMDEKYDWRRLSTLANRAHIRLEAARSILEELEKTRVVRKAYYVSMDGQELWGATNRVGLLPIPHE
jgi:transcription initiation factor IIF auxiliary subunit